MLASRPLSIHKLPGVVVPVAGAVPDQRCTYSASASRLGAIVLALRRPSATGTSTTITARHTVIRTILARTPWDIVPSLPPTLSRFLTDSPASFLHQQLRLAEFALHS